MSRRTAQYTLVAISLAVLVMLCMAVSTLYTPHAQGGETDSASLTPTNPSEWLYPTAATHVAQLIQTGEARETLTMAALPPLAQTSTGAYRRVISATIQAFKAQLLTETAMPTTEAPLISDNYLADDSVISGDPCGPPCFQNIVVGKTTFSDALKIIKANSMFSAVRSRDQPPEVAWSTAGGVICCQLSAYGTTNIVNAIFTKVKPTMTIQEVISKYGTPSYVNPVDYSDSEVALALLFPKSGLIVWVVSGNRLSILKPTDPIAAVLYADPADFPNIIETATLQGWNGYISYRSYRYGTPVVTPEMTLTPTS